MYDRHFIDMATGSPKVASAPSGSRGGSWTSPSLSLSGCRRTTAHLPKAPGPPRLRDAMAMSLARLLEVPRQQEGAVHDICTECLPNFLNVRAIASGNNTQRAVIPSRAVDHCRPPRSTNVPLEKEFGLCHIGLGHMVHVLDGLVNSAAPHS